MRTMLFLALAAVAAAETRAQVPLRYQPLEKGGRSKLAGVYGYPEIAASSRASAAVTGNRAIFVAGGGGGGEEKFDDSIVSVWDPGEAKVLREIRLPEMAVTALAIHPSGSKALAGLVKRVPFDKAAKDFKNVPFLGWIDLEAGSLTTKPSNDGEIIMLVTYAPSGGHVLVATEMGKAYLFTGENQDPNQAVKLGDAAKNPVVFDGCLLPGGKQAVLNVNNVGSKLWDLATGKPLQSYTDVPDRIYFAALSPDGKRLATVGSELDFEIWDVASGKKLAGWKQAEKNALNLQAISLLFSPDGKQLFSLAAGLDPLAGTQPKSLLGCFDIDAKKEGWNLAGQWQGQVPMQVRNGKLVLGGGGNAFETRKLEDGKLLSIQGAHKGALVALVATATDQLLSASLDDSVRLWQGQANTVSAVSKGITGLATDPHGKVFVTAGTDKTLKVWNLATGKLDQTLTGHKDNVTCVALTPDGKVVSGSNDRTVKVWDPKSGTEVLSFTGHAENINAVAVSADGDWAVSASDDNTIRYWPLKKKRQPFEDNEMFRHKRQVLSLAFSPDGKTLASGSQDKNVILWDFAAKKKLKTLEGHGNWVTALAFRSDGQIVSASDDLTVRIWDVDSGKEIERIDLGAASDCPKCLAVRDGSLFVGTAAWVVLRFELPK